MKLFFRGEGGGGANTQRINHDQLSLNQWVHGFCKNILNEALARNTMVSYIGDTTYFSWQGTKAAHAVLLCDMERGKVDWEDQYCIDWIRRVYAQKHVAPRLGDL